MPALNTHRRPFNTRGRGRGRPRLRGRGGGLIGSRSGHTAASHNYGEQKQLTPIRRGRGRTYPSSEKRASGMTFIRDIAAILGDPTAPGYKPREERSYLEFHPDLNVEMMLRVMPAELVDGDSYVPPVGPSLTNTATSEHSSLQPDIAHAVLPIRTSDNLLPPTPAGDSIVSAPADDDDDFVVSDLIPPPSSPPSTPVARPSRTAATTGRRPGPGRPPKMPKTQPKPPPQEILNLPKPSYRPRPVYNFTAGPAHAVSPQILRPTKPLQNVGYQEGELWERPNAMVREAGSFFCDDLNSSIAVGSKKEGSVTDGNGIVPIPEIAGVSFGSEGERVEYDMDEQDDKWLATHNSHRRLMEVEAITREMFEITMTKIEKEWCALERQIPKKPPVTRTPHPSRSSGVEGEGEGSEDSKCAICDDGECENSNAIVFCDGCDLAVHQDCYGVPHIPEGQWLCRRCLTHPHQTVNCIFCPNTDGAFKQTTNNTWAHLLCAIWIPEIVLLNPLYMEPIDGVAKIPRQRWKLTCYICRQKMGACIQCSNKNCFVAFHVTCARRARLYLKMKDKQGGAPMEPNLLKAFCDRHVPAEWRRENSTTQAVLDAQDWYAENLHGSGLAETHSQTPGPSSSRWSAGLDLAHDYYERPHTPLGTGDSASLSATAGTTGSGRRRKSQQTQPKNIWKLPSGAPVIPAVVMNAVVDSIQRFGVHKRKEFVAEACKYWSLKREARRGASLIKRLQLQLDASSELTRRNWKTVSQGRKKLIRRVEFAAKLRMDIEKLRLLCDDVKKREREKIKISTMLHEFTEDVYFPEISLMRPIIQEAEESDKYDDFKLGFSILKSRLQDRIYFTVDAFYSDLTAMLLSPPDAPKMAWNFPAELGIASPEMKQYSAAVSVAQATTESPLADSNVTNNQALKRAKRILNIIAPKVELAQKRENELKADPFELAAKEIEDRYEKEKERVQAASRTPASPVFTRGEGAFGFEIEMQIDKPQDMLHGNSQASLSADSELPVFDEEGRGHTYTLRDETQVSLTEDKMDIDHTAEHYVDADGEADMDADFEADDSAIHCSADTSSILSSIPKIEATSPNAQFSALSNDPTNSTATPIPTTSRSPPSFCDTFPNHEVSISQLPAAPPTATSKRLFPLNSSTNWSNRRPPWYLQEFDPRGLTLYEERWLGRDIVRELSPLSELSENEMRELADAAVGDGENGLSFIRSPPPVAQFYGSAAPAVGVQNSGMNTVIDEHVSVGPQAQTGLTQDDSAAETTFRACAPPSRKGSKKRIGRGKGRWTGKSKGRAAKDAFDTNEGEEVEETAQDGAFGSGTDVVAPLLAEMMEVEQTASADKRANSYSTTEKQEYNSIKEGISPRARTSSIRSSPTTYPQDLTTSNSPSAFLSPTAQTEAKLDIQGSDESMPDTTHELEPSLPVMHRSETPTSLQQPLPYTPKLASESSVLSTLPSDFSPLSNPPNSFSNPNSNGVSQNGSPASTSIYYNASVTRSTVVARVESQEEVKTPKKPYSRKGMIFARQSNGRFGSAKKTAQADAENVVGNTSTSKGGRRKRKNY